MAKRKAIGRTVIALSVIILVVAGAFGLIFVAPMFITSSAPASARELMGAESQCGFSTTCGGMSGSGLQLVLNINSTDVRPNGTIAITVTELNTLRTTNNVSSSSAWRLSTLTWLSGCGPPGYIPHGIELLKGYYTLGNLTSASLGLAFWGGITCPAEAANGWGVGHVTSYAFQPNSDTASYSADNITPPHPTFPQDPTSMLYGIDVFAGTVDVPGVNHISSVPATYTLVAGDEWGALVLSHFSVT